MRGPASKQTPRPRVGSSAHHADGEGKLVDLACAYCGGSGRDPFGVMSPLSTCQVCGGKGQNRLRAPVTTCAFCHGTGVNPGLRQTCLACDGTGYTQVPLEASVCPCCGGSGRASDYLWPDSPLTCSCCGGAGVVPASKAAANRERGREEHE